MTLKLEEDVKSVPTISLNLNDYASASAKQSAGTISSPPPKLDIPTASTPIRTSSLASPRSELGIPARDLELENGFATDGTTTEQTEEASQPNQE
jgi:hypothetical protein